MPIKVLYFSIVSVADLKQTNGGNLCCRNHIIRLHQDEGIDMHVVLAAAPHLAEGNVEFLTRLGVPHLFVPFGAGYRCPPPAGWLSRLRDWYRGQVSYPYELEARVSPGVQDALINACREWNIEVIVIDYLLSCLFCPHLLATQDNVILITLNREAEYFNKLQLLPNGRLAGLVSGMRLARFERRSYRAAKKVVSIGPPDLPRSRRLRSAPVCITPYLDPPSERWSFTDSRQAFFIGNINHDPNRLAMEWIATQLAPRAHQQRPDIEILVVGAEAEKVPPGWRHPAIKYLGLGDRDLAHRLFRTADVMLCPIENDYGMKFKAAEAVAYGTPMLASRQTLLGLPYLTAAPSLDLTDPAGAARLLCSLVGQRAALERISAQELAEGQRHRDSQRTVWSTLIGSMLGPAPRAA